MCLSYWQADSFNPLPSHEGRRDAESADLDQHRFQSTSLSRGKTCARKSLSTALPPFNPLPSHEGRPAATPLHSRYRTFQSTSLSRGKTPAGLHRYRRYHFQSTSLSRGKTYITIPGKYFLHLSIHFPLTREDTIYLLDELGGCLSIHFPLTREDNGGTGGGVTPDPFNPLPSHEGRPKDD